MQATATTPPPTPPTPPAPLAPDLPPAQPAGVPVTVTFTGTDGATQILTVPLSRQAVRDIRAQREELSNQLTSAVGRRRRLADEINQAPDGAGRSGLEQRLAVLDKRIVQLESDIAATGKQLSAAPLGLISSTGDFGGGRDMPDNVATIIGVFTLFVLFPIAIASARYIWRRAGKGPATSSTVQLPPQIDQRLERLEAGVDAIAIEIERVTEGQRFVTRLLAEQDTREKLPASGGGISS
jgi:hypothetical protein